MTNLHQSAQMTNGRQTKTEESERMTNLHQSAQMTNGRQTKTEESERMTNLHQSAQMTNKKQTRDIHDRVFNWVIKVLTLLDKVPYSTRNQIIVKQLTRSVTSTGANDQEADGASSFNDFIFKYELTKREAKESHYWLRILKSIIPKLKINDLIEEADQLIKIFSAIIQKTKDKKFPSMTA